MACKRQRRRITVVAVAAKRRIGWAKRCLQTAPGSGCGVQVVFVGRNRVVWKRVLLFVVTLGITRRIWLYRVNKEIDGHAALGLNHRLHIALLCVPILGPLWVQAGTAFRIDRNLHNGAGVKFGPPLALGAVGFVPILGNGFFLGWVQSRLNAYWAYEREHPSHGIDIDAGLQEDKKFLVAIEKARRESYHAGSRFDRRKHERQERWRGRIAHLETVGEERKQARAEGGTTPLLPWQRPQALERRTLSITCACGNKFQRTTAWQEDLELVCPKCGRKEVLAGVFGHPVVTERRKKRDGESEPVVPAAGPARSTRKTDTSKPAPATARTKPTSKKSAKAAGAKPATRSKARQAK